MTAAVRLPGSRKSGRGMAVLIALALAAPVGLVAVNAKPASRPRPAPAAKAPVVPEKPVLPHLILKPLPIPAEETELLQCWEVFYPEAFPFGRSNLSFDIGETHLNAELEKKPGFLLLWKGDTPEATYRLEPASAPPVVPLSEAEAARELTGRRTIPAADRKAVYTVLSRAGSTAAVTLQVDGIGPEELTNYRAIPSYR